MKVRDIKASNQKGYIRLGVLTEEGVRYFTLSEAQYRSIGAPLRDDELDVTTLESITELEEYNKAKKKALNILSFGDNSLRELIAKLIRGGTSADTAKRIAEEMQSLGYINEERQLERLIENEVNLRLRGPRKFIPKLCAKGYSVSDIRKTAERLTAEGRIDLAKARASLVEGITDREEIKKQLYKNGH